MPNEQIYIMYKLKWKLYYHFILYIPTIIWVIVLASSISHEGTLITKIDNVNWIASW
jgi:hypothetical protein